MAKTPVEIYKETEDVLFARYGDKDDGVIIYIDYKSYDPSISYFVEFEKVIVKNVNKSVYKSSVWRNDNSIGGIVKHIFFDILFEFNGSICSDSLQTKEGMKMWKTQLANAVEQGYYVGLWDSFDQEIDWFEPEKEKYKQWTDRVYDFAWDKTPEKDSYRFFISKTKI